MTDYVELHSCSAFSFLRGGSFPEQLAHTAAELEMPAMALLDRNGVYGAQRVSVVAREQNVRPIIGAELTMEDGGILPVLVENRAGYKNLCELLTEAHLRSEKGKCAVKWSELPQFAEGLVVRVGKAVENTSRLADRLTSSLENLGYEFPDFPVPAGHSMDSFLRTIVWFGAQQRYAAVSAKVKRQLEEELALISKLGFPGYFLIVWDIVNFCREHNIMVQGRGSAANSAVCYCLGITPVDPVSNNLVFERFLNESRKGWPDIDLPSGDRREAVIQEIYRRYGKHGAAMTANVITYRGRSAAREIGKALNFSPSILDRFSHLFANGDFPHTLDLQSQIEQAGLPKEHPRMPAFVRLYQAIYGLPRHLGQHAGGMIICQNKLSSFVPLENASMPGRVVAQWDKDDCEDLGIVKVDLLGLGMMSVMQDAFELCRERGRPLDLAHIPKDDAKTFEMMQRADTIGVFQIESRAQMATLPRLKPKCFYDVVIEVAIIRPGPIQGDMVHPYLARRAGREEIAYFDERLKPVLERTLGVPLFQEQMLKIAMIMANFSGDEAEELRRALSFHRSEERMNKVSVKLREAMARNNVAPEVIEKVLYSITSFALYGFPESHAISFAILAYGSAYMKVHRPAEFYASLINNQPMGFYTPATIVKDARRHGVKVKPVCVAHSEWNCSVIADETIRLGFCVVNGLQREHADDFLRERKERPFSSLEDFRKRAVLLTKDELRRLANLGALNCFAEHRRAALWKVEETPYDDLLDRGYLGSAGCQPANASPARTCGSLPQTSATRASDRDGSVRQAAGRGRLAACAPQNQSSPLPRMTLPERVRADYEVMDLTTGPHPMKLVRAQLPDIWQAIDLAQAKHGSIVRIAGNVICRQRPGTAKGFVFISLEDETGVSNAIVTPDLVEETRFLITEEPVFAIEGQVQNTDNVVLIKAQKILPLTNHGLVGSESHDFR